MDKEQARQVIRVGSQIFTHRLGEFIAETTVNEAGWFRGLNSDGEQVALHTDDVFIVANSSDTP